MTLSERIADIEARRNAATPGVWGSRAAVSGRYIVDNEIVEKISACGPEHGTEDDLEYDQVIADSKFLGSAPQDIDFLLAALKRAITVADDACDKECNPKTCSPCKLLAYLERFASKGNSCE